MAPRIKWWLYSSAPGGGGTWNPADKGAGVTLSAGDLTMAVAGVGNEAVRGTPALSGKIVAEIVVDNPLNLLSGVGTAAMSLATFVGATATGWGWLNDGRVFNNGAVIATYAAYVAGDLISVIYDSALGMWWSAKNGVVQAGDPVGGTGGVNVGVGPMFVAGSGSGGSQQTLQAATFIPVGFTSFV